MDPKHIEEITASADCLYTKKEVEAALDALAFSLNQRLTGKQPIFLCVMVGGIIPIGNLLPRLNFPLELDYVHATRYRGKTVGGELHWIAKHRLSLKDRTVVVVDDILDTGLTLKAVLDVCRAEGAKEVFSVVLIDRPDARKPEGEPTADFIGLSIANRYVYGYGLDYKEYLRNMPGIYAIKQEFEGK